MQEPRSSGGDGTRFVRSRADVDALVARGALGLGARYLVRERVDGGARGATVFVAPGLVALSALRLQAYHPRDHDDGPGAFAGVQWLASDDLSARARSRVEAALFGVGERLYARRFFGFANVDLMLDRRDRALILECNPRMSAATPELLRSPALVSGVETGARFLAGFLGQRAWRRRFERVGLPVTASRPASLDVVFHGARGVVTRTIASGVYAFDGDALAYVGPDVRRLDAGEVAIVVMAREGQPCERGDTLATAMSTEALYDGDGAMLPIARALLARLPLPRRGAASMNHEPVDLSHVAAEILTKREALLAVAARGTPAYAFDRAAFGAALDAFERAFSAELPGHRAFYAVKSNHHPLVVEEAARRGFGLDVSSGRELDQALAIDGAPIVFSGPAKAPGELDRAVANADRVTVHLDSFRELERLGDATTKLGRSIKAGVRVSTDHHGAWSKFGVPLADLARFVRAARAHPLVDLRGVQFHLSWNRDATPYERILEDLATVIARDLTAEERARLAFVDVGGGYRPHALEGEFTAEESAGAGRAYASKPSITVEAYARALGDAFRTHLSPLASARVYTEPGRVVSTHAMHLLLRVVDKKSGDLVIVDGGVNMVGWEKYLHVACPVVNLTRPSLAEIPVRIGGSLCDCEDVWGFHCFAERVEEGDVLVVPMQGAYGFSVAQSFIRDVPPVRELGA